MAITLAGWSKSPSSAAAASDLPAQSRFGEGWGGEAYSVRYVEAPSAVRTKLADFFNILLGKALPKSANLPLKSRAKPNRIAPDLVEVKEGNRQSSLLHRRMPSYSL